MAPLEFKSTLNALLKNLIAMASNLRAMASNLLLKTMNNSLVREALSFLPELGLK